MKLNLKNIDIREDYLSKKDDLLEILLQDKTTSKNIPFLPKIWVANLF